MIDAYTMTIADESVHIGQSGSATRSASVNAIEVVNDRCIYIMTYELSLKIKKGFRL